MNTSQTHDHLPVKGDLLLIYIFSFLITILMMATSVAGLLYQTDLYPTQQLIQTFVPNDVVNLFVGLPILLYSMWLTWRGKLIGLLCWSGALFFVFYSYIAYVFAMPLNWVYPLHLILTVLSLYTLIGLVTNMDGNAIQQRLSGAVPEKLAGGISAGLGSLFLLRVIGVFANAITSGTLIAETELAVNVSDLLITPAWIIGGILLWQRKPFGYMAGLGLLFQGSMLFIALIAFLLLQPLLTAAPFAIADVIVIFVMGLICFIPFVLFARGAVEKSKTSSKKEQP